MPRRMLLKVVDFPAYRLGTVHPVGIREIRQDRKADCLRLGLEHLGKEQEGRRVEVQLPLPVRPHGPTSDFLRACGCDVQLGTEIDLHKLVGKVLGVRFSQTNEPCAWVAMKPPDEEAGK